MDRGGLEIIPNFEIKYPEYSVITPHTNQEYTIRSLKVGEEETLRSSLLTPTALTAHLNKTIFNCLVKKPEAIATLEDFLNKNTVADREALMFGLYHITYKDEHAYDVTCVNCDHVNPVKIKFGDSFSMVAWKGKEDILKKEIPVPMEMAEAVTIILKQPSLKKEQDLMESLKFSSEEDREKQISLLPIDRIEIDMGKNVTDKGKDQIKDRSNIKTIYNDLPAQDRSLIEKAYNENFGKYGVTIKTVVRCEKCQHQNETEIDLIRQFFRAVYG